MSYNHATLVDSNDNTYNGENLRITSNGTVTETPVSFTKRVMAKYSSGSSSGDYRRPTSVTSVLVETPMQLPYKYFWTRRGTEYFEDKCSAFWFGKHFNEVFESNGNAVIGSDFNRENRLKTECLAKLGEANANVGVALAESMETAQSIAKLSLEAWDLLRDIKRADLKKLKKKLDVKPRDVPDKLSDRWLEFNYAVTPLLSDIHDLKDVFNNGLDSRLSIRAFRQLTESSKKSSDIYPGSISADVDDTLRCKIAATVSDLDSQGKKLIGMSDPKAIAWELVPFSFVVDWGMPIGTWLQALNGTVGLDFDYGYVSRKVVIKGNCGNVNGANHPEETPAHFTITGYGRDILPDFPAPMPYVKSPWSTSHGVTALALLNQLRK